LARAEVAKAVKLAPNYTEARQLLEHLEKSKPTGGAQMNARGQWFRSPAKFCISSLCLALLSPASITAGRNSEAQNSPLVLELKLDREVEPVLATYIDEGLAEATEAPGSLVLITMDTPRRLSDSMTDMIHHILDSPVPVAVFVSPPARVALPRVSLFSCPLTLPPWRQGRALAHPRRFFSPVDFRFPMDEVLRRKSITTRPRSSVVSRKSATASKLAETSVTDAQAFTRK